jgi:hypothetical protein
MIEYIEAILAKLYLKEKFANNLQNNLKYDIIKNRLGLIGMVLALLIVLSIHTVISKLLKLLF